jgi:hypothetical protein
MTAKAWYLSKVFWFNALSVVLFFMESQELINLIPPGYTDEFASILGLVNLGLRFITSGPLTATTEKAEALNAKVLE